MASQADIAFLLFLSGIGLGISVMILLYNFKRYRDLKEKQRQELAAIRKSIEKKYDLRFGRIYSYPMRDGIKTSVVNFDHILNMGLRGMVISASDISSGLSSVARRRIMRNITVSRKRGEDSILPTKLEFLLGEIEEFIQDIEEMGKEGVILIECTDVLMKNNSFRRFENFFSNLKELIDGRKVMVIIHLPEGGEYGEYIKYLRENTTVMDHTPGEDL